jgi:hypothetical protein
MFHRLRGVKPAGGPARIQNPQNALAPAAEKAEPAGHEIRHL